MHMKRRFWVSGQILLLVLYSFGTTSVFPWGQNGHRIIGALAEKYLTKPAKKQVRQILKGYKLQDVSNWADEIRSEKGSFYRSFQKWHFMEAEEPEMIQALSNTLDAWPEDIQEAIDYCVDQLKKQPKEAKLQQAILLKMLVHLVGDAHQPLHVGNGKDKGGNQCYVRWFYSKFPTTLHQVWDTKLIESSKYSYSEYADYLGHISKKDQSAWQQDSPAVWLQESRALHKDIYPVTKKYTSVDYCNSNRSQVDYARMPTLSFAYIYKMRPIMEKRLQKSGVRLAGVLNQLWK